MSCQLELRKGMVALWIHTKLNKKRTSINFPQCRVPINSLGKYGLLFKYFEDLDILYIENSKYVKNVCIPKLFLLIQYYTSYIHPSTWPSVHLSFSLSVHLMLSPTTALSIHPYIYLFIHPTVPPYVLLSIHE